MKQLFRTFICLLVFNCFLIIQAGSGFAAPTSETLDLAPGAQAAILMDVTSGRVLYEKNADNEMPIASLTKIMTAIIAVENGKMDDLVEINRNAVGVEGSSIYLKIGEKIPLSTLLYGLMLRSGNDAATAIAEKIGGSIEGFVFMMNQKAEYLGLQHTHFMNPHGLDQKDHYSSAKDLAILTAYALKNPTFKEIVKTEVKTVPWPGEQWSRKFYNKNKMLRFYQWADGVKTGFTKTARRTLVSSATKDGEQLVAVTLNDGDDWKDHMNMFEYGFNHYDLVPLLKKGQVISKTPFKNKEKEPLQVVSENEFQYALTDEEKKQITVDPIISYPLKLVDRENMQVGSARIYLKDDMIGSIPLITDYVESSSLLSDFKYALGYVLGQGGS